MAAVAARRIRLVLQKCPNLGRTAVLRSCSSKTEGSAGSEDDKKLGGFARSFQRQFQSEKIEVPIEPAKEETFASLLRNSKFTDLGDPRGKVVIGVIEHITGDDLYIDFGLKFPCVCVRPAKNGEGYVRGAKVRLRVNELELSTKFLGSERDMTLLEADCTLLGLVYSSSQPKEYRVQS